LAKRLQAMGARGYENGFSTVTLIPERLTQPLSRRKPTLYFVNSMSDLFQDSVPFTFIDQVVEVIEATPRHAYQILTKRADRMKEYFTNRKVPKNAWLGVSVEDRKYGTPRIATLRKIRAKTRFLSIEPLLEDLGTLNLSGIHWVIVGGESGPKARPMLEKWAVNIKDQCLENEIDFFFKQWGSYGRDGVRRSKRENGRVLEGRTWNIIPVVSLA
jgi:protein gp37